MLPPRTPAPTAPALGQPLRPDMLARRLPAQGQVRATLPSLPPSSAWVALAHPGRWALVHDNEGQWHVLPDLARIFLVSGVGSVVRGRDASGQAVPDARLAVALRASEGYVEVPPTPVVAWGETRPDYCIRFRVERGAWAHVWAWEQPEVVAGNRTVMRVDHDVRVAFLRNVADNVLGMSGPPDDVLEQIRGDLRDRARTLAVQARQYPTRATALAHVAERLVSLGWAEGLDLPPVEVRPTRPAPLPPEAPVAEPTDDVLQQVRRMTPAQLDALRAALGAPAAPPPAQGVVVGSPSAAEAALGFLDEGPAPKPKTPKG